MTDERMGDALWPALRRLPPGSGVVFRHHATSAAERRGLQLRVRRIARARGLILLVAGQAVPGAAGRHGTGRTAGWRSWAVHDGRDLRAARHADVDLIFVSPVHTTRSHPGIAATGAIRLARLARSFDGPAIALGGMDEQRWRRIARLGFDGWAAIDAWLR